MFDMFLIVITTGNLTLKIFIQYMPVILGGDIKLPDDTKLRVYRNDKIELEKNELVTLATIYQNGKHSILYFS